MLALIQLENGKFEPKVVNLKEMIHYYILHQQDVIRRRTRYDLEKAEARAHILEGLKIALDHLDEVINIIRHSERKPGEGKTDGALCSQRKTGPGNC